MAGVTLGAQRVLVAARAGFARKLLCEQLTADGAQVHTAATRQQAEEHLATRGVDLLLLAGLPGSAEAVALLSALRAAGPRTGLAVLTLGPSGPCGELHAVRALEAGSDQHVPAAGGYLLIRAAALALLRTLARGGPAADCELRLGSLLIDPAARQVSVDTTRVEMTQTEFRLLTTLAKEPVRVFTKDELSAALWPGECFARTRSLDTYACRLRAKLARAGHAAVHNVWGVGYCLHQA